MSPDPSSYDDRDIELSPFLRDAYERLLAVLDILEAINNDEQAIDPDLPEAARPHWTKTVYEAESVVLLEIQQIAVESGPEDAKSRLVEFYYQRLPEKVNAFTKTNPIIPNSLEPYLE